LIFNITPFAINPQGLTQTFPSTGGKKWTFLIAGAIFIKLGRATVTDIIFMIFSILLKKSKVKIMLLKQPGETVIHLRV